VATAVRKHPGSRQTFASYSLPLPVRLG